MNQTARSNRYHIGIFGRRNAGKSSLINAITGQDTSIVSHIAGTTTDTVWKNIELPKIGAAVIADTAGYDDCGELGEKRVERTKQSAARIDLALLLLDSDASDVTPEKEWMQYFSSLNIPVITLLGKCEEESNIATLEKWEQQLGTIILPVSSKTGEGIDKLLTRIAEIYSTGDNDGEVIQLDMSISQHLGH